MFGCPERQQGDTQQPKTRFQKFTEKKSLYPAMRTAAQTFTQIRASDVRHRSLGDLLALGTQFLNETQRICGAVYSNVVTNRSKSASASGESSSGIGSVPVFALQAVEHGIGIHTGTTGSTCFDG